MYNGLKLNNTAMYSWSIAPVINGIKFTLDNKDYVIYAGGAFYCFHCQCKVGLLPSYTFWLTMEKVVFSLTTSYLNSLW